MPNHVTNRVWISGPTSEILRFKMQTFDPNGQFNFERVIPMPEELNHSLSAPHVEEHLSFFKQALARRGKPQPELTFLAIANDDAWDFYQQSKWPSKLTSSEREDLKQLLLSIAKEDLAELQQALDRMAKYHHLDWYGWSLANWGTKWNAYSFHMVNEHLGEQLGKLEFLFDTAWSPPQLVMQRVARLFPQLTIETAYFDEGYGFAGRTHSYDGSFVDSPYEPDDEIYEVVYGEPPPPPEEDEE